MRRRLPGRRWSVVLWSVGLMMVAAVVTNFDPTSAPAGLRNPLGIKALTGLANAIGGLFVAVFLGTSLAAVASLVVRYRRGSAIDREQLKWLMAAAAVLFLAFGSSILVPFLSNGIIVPLAAAALPIAIGIAVLRYRLYDIDFIINKSLVYGGLALVITAVYVLVVINIGAMVGGSQRLWLSLLTRTSGRVEPSLAGGGCRWASRSGSRTLWCSPLAVRRPWKAVP